MSPLYALISGVCPFVGPEVRFDARCQPETLSPGHIAQNGLWMACDLTQKFDRGMSWNDPKKNHPLLLPERFILKTLGHSLLSTMQVRNPSCQERSTMGSKLCAFEASQINRPASFSGSWKVVLLGCSAKQPWLRQNLKVPRVELAWLCLQVMT